MIMSVKSKDFNFNFLQLKSLSVKILSERLCVCGKIVYDKLVACFEFSHVLTITTCLQFQTSMTPEHDAKNLKTKICEVLK